MVNDDERRNESSSTLKKADKRFFCGHLKYEGYELERTSTHIKIFDTKVKRKFELPITTTVVEDL